MTSHDDRLPYFPWYYMDWRADFKVQRLPWQARGLYREILDECWHSGYVPDDMDQLADICRCDLTDIAEHWRQIKPLLREVPQSDGHLFESARLERERGAITETSRRRAEAGRKGGKSRNRKEHEAGLSRAKLSEQIRTEQSRATGDANALSETPRCTCTPARQYAPGTGVVFWEHEADCAGRGR